MSGTTAHTRFVDHARTDRPTSELSRRDRRAATDEIVAALADAEDSARDRLVSELIEVNMGVARSVAARYRNRGEDFDDLEQVAYVGLAKAAHGFDPTQGHDFLTYAVPTIRGEVRRYFRDSCWMVRPTRRIQETRAKVAACTDELAQELGGTPTAAMIAERLGVDVDDVRESAGVDGCYHPSSFDATSPGGVGTLGDVLGEEDRDFERTEQRASLVPLLRELSARDRETLALRYFDGWTQEKIAGRLGVTQMQVSRILTRITRELRDGLGDGLLAA